MPVYFLGKSITLSASGSDRATFTPDRDVTVHRIGFSSTGAFKIDRIEHSDLGELVDGSLHNETLKKNGNGFDLAEPLPLPAKKDFVIHLTDLSGSSNTVYITLFCTR